MKKQTAANFNQRLTATFFTLLGLTFNANTALGDATWNGGGGADTSWNNMANWTGDPKAGGKWFLDAMPSAFTSTIDFNTTTAPWTNATGGRSQWNSFTTIYLLPGGQLGTGSGDPRWKSTSVGSPRIYVQGGSLMCDIGEGLESNPIIEISSGKYEAARITYQKYATINIIGSTPTLVKVSDFFSWMNNSLPTLGFTLDAAGVTPLTFNTHGNDSVPNGNTYPGLVTINVSGIAAYAAGSRPLGDTFYLAKDLNSPLFHPNAWPNNVLVDGGLGRLDRVSDGVTLTILNATPPPFFEITNFDRDPITGHVTLTFTSVDSANYTIERSADGTTWGDVDDNVDGQAGTTTYIDTTAAPFARLLYRVTQNP